MKKIILFLSLFCILCIPSQVNAYNYENISQIEYLEDGSYIETTILYLMIMPDLKKLLVKLLDIIVVRAFNNGM